MVPADEVIQLKVGWRAARRAEARALHGADFRKPVWALARALPVLIGSSSRSGRAPSFLFEWLDHALGGSEPASTSTDQTLTSGMALTLLLLRHAKSSWDDPARADFDRPLNARGGRAAPRMARALRARGWSPALVLCSSAARARATWELVRTEINGTPEVRFEERLYMASPEVLLAEIRQVDRATGPSSPSPLLIVGHNPGMHELALQLVTDGDPDALRALGLKLPTAGLVVIDFPLARWSEVAPGRGRLEAFLTPRGLE